LHWRRLPSLTAALTAAIPPHFSTNPKGFIGGGELGYNQQIGQFVWGVEADLSGADIKGSYVLCIPSNSAARQPGAVTVDAL